MNQSDAYYRALRAYRERVAEARECVRDARAFADAEAEGRMAVTQVHCIVDEAWIRAIEEGLVHIEKALKEERQFILSNGEVVPIEKVKSVSKESIRHLARHAELITRAQKEGEALTPDKLYTVERLSDYAVYENRFLYMLLCYLRDFVSLRYQRILELTNRYEGTLSLRKEVATMNRTVSLSIDLHDERRDDPYLQEHNTARDLIDRMDLILKTVLAFLSTPLMESAGKAALLKPPITKTNVLKMDNNFKGAVALYDYIIAYEELGYTVKEDQRVLDIHRADIAEDLAEAELLLAYLTYSYGLGLREILASADELDRAKAHQAALRRRTEQLEATRRRLTAEGEGIEAYVLHLEKQVRDLQKEADRAEPLYTAIHALEQREIALRAETQTLTQDLTAATTTLRETELAHAETLRETEERHAAEQQALLTRQEAELAALTDQYATARAGFSAELNTHLRAAEEAYAERERRAVEALQKVEQTLSEARAEIEALTEENRLLSARVMGQRMRDREITPEEREALTEKENFDELERQLAAFVRFYESQWRRTKRKIRKDLLNIKYIKGQSGKE